MKTNIFIYLIATCCAMITVSIFYPGLMSFDSLDQYRQARGITDLNSHHPIIMTLLWSGLMRIWDEVGVFLILQQILYWFLSAALANIAGNHPWSKIAIFLLIGFYPPLFIHSVHIWKDVGLNISATIVVIAILYDLKQSRPMLLWLSILPLFYAFTVRSNAPLGLMPIIILWSWRISESSLQIKRYHLSTITALTLTTTLAFMGANTLINIHSKNGIGVKSILLWDLAAISKDRKENLIPAYARMSGSSNIETISKTFNPIVNVPTIAITDTSDTYSNKEIFLDWARAVMQNHKIYLKHREYVFRHLLSFGTETVYYPFHPGIDPNEMGLALSQNKTNIINNSFYYFSQVSKTIIYRPWIYIILSSLTAVLSLYAAIRTKDNKYATSFLVAVSGITMTIPLFFIAPSADFRYNLWLIQSSILSIIILILPNSSCRRDDHEG